MKKCGRCQIEKEDTDFSPSQLERSGGICRPCCTEKAQDYRNRNRDKVRKYEQEYRPKYLEKHGEKKATYQREYYQDNKEEMKANSKKHRENNRDELIIYAKQYYQENKEELKMQAKEYRQEHKEEVKQWRRNARSTPWGKIHHNVSGLIRITIQRNGSSKSGNSIIDHLGYTIQELKEHIEKQFEPWMTWDNWGKYDVKNWDDNDSSTWTWQIDHIIPQSDFSYTSMDDENFKKCWDLSNLRPYSAKLNSIEGANRTRHNTIK